MHKYDKRTKYVIQMIDLRLTFAAAKSMKNRTSWAP